MQPFRPTSSLKNDQNAMARPISAIKAAGFYKTDKPRSVFDDLQPEDTDQSIERQIETLEISIFQNIREAMALVSKKQYSQANAKLSEASAFLGYIKKINAQYDQADLMAANVSKLDCVIRRHAIKVFIAAKYYDLAIQQCEKMLKVTQAAETAEVRMLMGNCYYYKNDFEKAHKQFSMALDIVPAENYSRLRYNIAKQIAITQIKMNRWNQAVDVIEENLIKSLSAKTAKSEPQENMNIYALMTKFSPIFTLILCYYAINDQRYMLDAFKKLIETCKLIGDNPDIFDDEDNPYIGDNVMNNGGDDELDSLSRYNAGIRHELRSKLLYAARLLAPVICHKEIDGYERLAELLREKGHYSISLYVLMSKALYQLDKNDFEEATKTMREIDRVGLESALAMGINVPHYVLESCKDASLTIYAAAEQNKPKEEAAEALGIDKKLIIRNYNYNYQDMERERQMSAKPISANNNLLEKHNRIPYATFVPRGVHTNIAFIHYLKGDYESAFKHAQTATIVDPFDSFAKVNLGCTYARLENYIDAQKQFYEAYDMNPDCLYAVYNNGLIFFKQDKFEEALLQFSTVVRRIPRQADAIFMCSECLIYLKRVKEAIDMLNKLMTIYSAINTYDPCVYSRLGELYAINGDESQGAHYFKEAHRLLPYDLNIIKWLGSFYVRYELYEQARQCFERGARVDYLTPQWFLSAAACLRKTNQTRQAIDEYRKILRKWPTCTDALKYLIVCLQSTGYTEEAGVLTQRLEKIYQNAAHEITNEIHGTAVLDPKVVRVADDKVKVVENQPELENDEDLFGNDDVANKLIADEENE